VGVGINVNQREFSPDLPNPTSMFRETGREFDCAELLADFERALERRYGQLRGGEAERLQRDYHQRMYRLGERHTYALPSGERFEATLRGVMPSGDLLLDHADGSRHSYLFKEVEFVIDGRD
jgi:BirA family biotin operon repressor/biotin-[acetyl-CoA-carboxylase] ligase